MFRHANKPSTSKWDAHVAASSAPISVVTAPFVADPSAPPVPPSPPPPAEAGISTAGLLRNLNEHIASQTLQLEQAQMHVQSAAALLLHVPRPPATPPPARLLKAPPASALLAAAKLSKPLSGVPQKAMPLPKAIRPDNLFTILHLLSRFNLLNLLQLY